MGLKTGNEGNFWFGLENFFDNEGKRTNKPKIDTKKPLNCLKLNGNKRVLVEDLLCFYKDGFFKFVLKGEDNNCNIIHNGKIAKLVPLSNIPNEHNIVYASIDGMRKYRAYNLVDMVGIFDVSILKVILQKKNIQISKLLKIQNKINKKATRKKEKQAEEREIRDGYGF